MFGSGPDLLIEEMFSRPAGGLEALPGDSAGRSPAEVGRTVSPLRSADVPSSSATNFSNRMPPDNSACAFSQQISRI